MSYMQGCKGDSGSGQFISNNVNEYMNLPKDNGNLRYVLAAIDSKSTFPAEKDLNGKILEYPCGTFTYDPKLKTHKGTGGISISTTYHEILNWIKRKSNIRGKLEKLLIRPK